MGTIPENEWLALAERCEAASGADRELDRDIAIAAFVGREEGGCLSRARKVILSHGARPENYEVVEISGVSLRTPPSYSASIDSAMTLVGYTNGRPHNLVLASAYGSAYVVPDDGDSYGVNDPLKGEGRAIGDDEIGRCARAICAAALRARASGGVK